MMDDDILYVIRAALCAVDPDRSAHYGGLNVGWTIDDLGCDSVTVVELINEVERTTGVQIPDEDLLDVRSIEDLVKLVRQYQ